MGININKIRILSLKMNYLIYIGVLCCEDSLLWSFYFVCTSSLSSLSFPPRLRSVSSHPGWHTNDLLTHLGQCLGRRHGQKLLYCLQHSGSIFFMFVAGDFLWITRVKMMHITTRWNVVDHDLPCSVPCNVSQDSTENRKCMAILIAIFAHNTILL